MGVRTSAVTYNIYICIYITDIYASGGHTGRRRVANGGLRRTRTGGYPDRRTPRRALRYRGVRMLTLWEREDTEGAQSRRQGRCINTGVVIEIICVK